MSTITLYYCSFCESVNKMFAKMITTCEAVGTARAAAELSRQGFHEEAKNLILSVKDK
jgi:hypothetical protein